MKTYLVQQKIQPLVNQYAIYEAKEDGSEGPMVAFAQQKRLALKEKITMYADQDRKQILFEIQARQVIDLGARYDIKDASGNVLGVVGKNFKASLLNSTWNMYLPDADDKGAPALVVSERDTTIALLRRIWGFIPFIGDIPFFVKFHFDFADSANKVVAKYDKTTTLRDHYRLEISDEAESLFDWRVFAAMGVALDALQSR